MSQPIRRQDGKASIGLLRFSLHVGSFQMRSRAVPDSWYHMNFLFPFSGSSLGAGLT